MYEAKGDRGDCGFDGGLNPGTSGCGAQQGASGAGDSGTNGSATEQSAASNASDSMRPIEDVLVRDYSQVLPRDLG